MGNCIFGGGGGDDGEEQSVEQMIKVVTSTGGVMELYAPITAGCVINEFPGHDLFCGGGDGGGGGRPLFPYENLHVGFIYHLIPNSDTTVTAATPTTTTTTSITPYRMSNIVSCRSSRSNNQGRQMSEEIRRLEEMNVVRPASGTVRYNSNGTSRGVWKVRLVIDPEQLSEILSQEVKTGELIESVRTVARCGGGRKSCSSSSSTTARGGETGGGGGFGWSRWNGAAAQ